MYEIDELEVIGWMKNADEDFAVRKAIDWQIGQFWFFLLGFWFEFETKVKMELEFETKVKTELDDVFALTFLLKHESQEFYDFSHSIFNAFHIVIKQFIVALVKSCYFLENSPLLRLKIFTTKMILSNQDMRC